MGHRCRSARLRLVVLIVGLVAALAACGVVQPYDGPPTYGNFRGTHGA